MRFKYDSYGKLYPRQEITQPEQYETVVESFTPSKDVPQDAPAAPTPGVAQAPQPEPIAQMQPQIDPPITPIPEPIQEGNVNGHSDTN